MGKPVKNPAQKSKKGTLGGIRWAVVAPIAVIVALIGILALIPGITPGEGGVPTQIDKSRLNSAELAKFEKGYKDHAFNEYVSNLISLHRKLPFVALEQCKSQSYSSNLPDMSVIICFHNEAWSTLLRTVHSVLDRTPSHLLKEVVLVDDASEMEHLRADLENYVSRLSKVRLLREPMRVGLIRARLSGVKVAEGQVLTFLDAHCEVTEGWAEPLLDRIVLDHQSIAVPAIDPIDENTFQYTVERAVVIGGFDWNMQFIWRDLPRAMAMKRKSPIEPIRTPVMSGGLFAIDKNFFQKLGTYDPGFDVWGGEQFELSFKAWMCGGRVEIIPCSHVGHVYRQVTPYRFDDAVDTIRRNLRRVTEVWMDDYKYLHYERHNNRTYDYGDISDRIALRKSLECKTFEWYLKEVYPEQYVPKDLIAKGEIRNLGSQPPACIESVIRGSRHPDYSVDVMHCHLLGENQFFELTSIGELRRDTVCIEVRGVEMRAVSCRGTIAQKFEYNHETGRLLHVQSNMCVAISQDGSRWQVDRCQENNALQMFRFQQYFGKKIA